MQERPYVSLRILTGGGAVAGVVDNLAEGLGLKLLAATLVMRRVLERARTGGARVCALEGRVLRRGVVDVRITRRVDLADGRLA